MRLPPPIDQEVFYEQMQKVCRSDGEKACVMLLWRTGMHAVTLVERAFSIEGDFNGNIHWRRTKNKTWLTSTFTKAETRVIKRVILAGTLPATQGILRRWLRRIGERAGYAEVTPLTLRHSRAIFLLDKGKAINRVASLMGCSWAVLERHYAVIENAREVQR